MVDLSKFTPAQREALLKWWAENMQKQQPQQPKQPQQPQQPAQGN